MNNVKLLSLAQKEKENIDRCEKKVEVIIDVAVDIVARAWKQLDPLFLLYTFVMVTQQHNMLSGCFQMLEISITSHTRTSIMRWKIINYDTNFQPLWPSTIAVSSSQKSSIGFRLKVSLESS